MGGGLHAAISRGGHESLEALLASEDTDLSFSDELGNTVMLTACSKGDKKIVRALLRAGCSVNDQVHAPLICGSARLEPLRSGCMCPPCCPPERGRSSHVSSSRAEHRGRGCPAHLLLERARRPWNLPYWQGSRSVPVHTGWSRLDQCACYSIPR